MKNKFKNILFIIMVSVFALMISGCEESEVEPDYSFEVVSSDDGFSGYYKIDGGAAKEFNGSAMSDSTVYYSFNKDLKSPESVLVSATGTANATSISIYIYEKNELVKSVTVSQVTDSVAVTATISYSFDTSDSDDTDDSTESTDSK